ncbi:FtsX-like permease family protein [Actinacidiphila glaucinigra]|uniref:FtsX-like permease family protein n=1 Tax=Actinacidiphila glaucinigra TaxID=235986 RepID=UPI0033EF8B8C
MPKSRTSRVHGDVSWIRARFRAAPGATVALAALVLVTAFLAAALPRVVDRYENDALRDSLRRSTVVGRSVSMSLDVSRMAFPYNAEALLTPDALASAEGAFQQVVRPPLALDKGQTVYGVRTARANRVTDPGLPRITKSIAPEITLVAQQDLAARIRVVAGRLPRPGGKDSGVIEAAVTDRTAKVMGLNAGRLLHIPGPSGETTVRITGILTPRSPSATYWKSQPDLRAPSVIPLPTKPDPTYYWHFTALIDPNAAPALLGLRDGAQAYWHHPVAIDTLTARDAPAARVLIAALNAGPDAARLQTLARQPSLTVEEEGLADVLTSFLRERAAAQPLVMVAAVGSGTVAALVLVIAAGLQAARRRAELTLLRARGIALPGLAARLLGESTVVAAPSAALGLGLALALFPAERLTPSVVLAAAVAVMGSLALSLRAVVVARRPRPEQREDLVAVRPSRRRAVGEVTIAVMVIGAVIALRRRGTADGGADVLIAAAPVLVAVVAALVLLRWYPLPVRLLGRPAARLKGAVLLIGVARAGRTPATAALPLLAMITALTVTSFGGAVLAGVKEGRDHAALTAVGADARLESTAALPKGLEARIRLVPGVRDTVRVHIERARPATSTGLLYTLIVADPQQYAHLAAETGLGAPLPAGALAADDGREPLPAVVSPRLARAFGGSTGEVPAAAGPTRVRFVATRDVSPAVTSGDFMIVSAAAMRRAHPDARPQLLAPNVILASGADLDATALRTVARKAALPGMRISSRSQERAAYGRTTALQSGARGVYLAAVAAGAGFSAVALLLSLLHNAPQRRALLARLRTMGMTSRQRSGLAVLEMLPLVLLAAVGGVLVSAVTVPLLRPGVDLTALAFTTTTPATDVSAAVLRTDLASLLLPSAVLTALACAVLAAQAWATGRRGEGTELRIGDRA